MDRAAVAEHNALMRDLYQRAQRGDADAMYRIGLDAEFPSRPGLRPNGVTAANWYKRAADGRSLPAAYRLGILYMSGRGPARNVDQAYHLMRWASFNGYAPAAVFISQNFTREDVRRYTAAEKAEVARQFAAKHAQAQAMARRRDAAAAAQEDSSSDLGKVLFGLFIGGAGLIAASAVLGSHSGTAGSEASPESPAIIPTRPSSGPDSAQCQTDLADVRASKGTGLTEMDGTSGVPASCR